MFCYVLLCFTMFYYVSQIYKRLHPTCFICGPGFDMFRTGRRLQQCHLQPLARNNYHDWGWLLHPIHRNSGDDFGMVYGIGFTTLNIHNIYIHMNVYTCIHTYIFLWDATNERQKSESINFNCSERFESCKWTLFLYSRRHVQWSSTKVQRSLNSGRLDGPRSRHRRRHPGT